MASKKSSAKNKVKAGAAKNTAKPVAAGKDTGNDAPILEEMVASDMTARQDDAPNSAVEQGADFPAAETPAPTVPDPKEKAIDAVDSSVNVPVVEEIEPVKVATPQERGGKKDEAPAAAKAGKGDAPGVSGPRLPGGISPRPVYGGDPYLPRIATVEEIIEETPNIRTLRVVLDDAEAMRDFTFEPGQVGQLSVFGAGEATFVINSTPSNKDYLQFSVMRTGEVTDAIHRLVRGDKIGLRAPLGNFFPYAEWRGKNVFFIGGGIGMAPIRTIMLYLLEHRQDYGKISLLYGARSPRDMAYSYELDAWKNNPDLDCNLCIDNPYENWEHRVGLIPKVLEELHPEPENTVAVLCGPPIMIKFTLQSLQKLGFEPDNIVTTLEKRMKCGIGICGRCNIGDRYVCVDGPVFSLRELDGLPADL